MKHLLFLLSLLPAAVPNISAQPASENPGMPEKMCWAHFCGWGFNVVENFDQPERFLRLYDRTLLGKHTGTDLGITSSTRNQIRAALEYGVDGFCVDIVRLDGYSSMGRLYRAAEGLPFKIALCVDGWRGEIPDVVDALAKFFDANGTHPNNYFIDGRPVAFIYSTHRSLPDCEAIVRGLNERGHRPYWLVQPQRETSLWSNTDVLGKNLAIFDGFYDFGVNGYPVEKMTERLTNGQSALAKKRPNGLLCAGISQGYLGPHNGFYRPYLGTATLRDNWAAATAANADWVCLCTWNDYNETTYFEPAVWGRDSLLKVNAEYLRQWRGEPMPNRPPRVIVSYREETLLGDDLTIEVLNLPYSTSPRSCHVRLLDPAGTPVKAFSAVALDKAALQARTLRLEAPGLTGPRLLRVQAALADDGTTPTDESWRELYPIVIRPGTIRAWRTLRLDLDDILPSPTASVEIDGESTRITASFRGWSWWGNADLIRNGCELRTQDVAKFGPVTTSVTFNVTDEDQRTPEDIYVIRFQRKDWKMAFAPPVRIARSTTAKAPNVTLPVIVRGADSDESWGDRPWRTPWRLTAPEVQEATLPADAVFTILLPLDRDSGDYCEDRGGWSTLAQRGNASRWGGIKPDHQPQWITTDGPGHVRRTCLHFDGVDDNVTFPFRTLPAGPLTLEVTLRLPALGRDMTVFSDQNGGIGLTIDTDGHVIATRGKSTCRSTDPLQPGHWYHIAAIYDGCELRTLVNGTPAATLAVHPTIHAINSRPVIGARMREGNALDTHLAADLAGFALTARPLETNEFVLPLADTDPNER